MKPVGNLVGATSCTVSHREAVRARRNEQMPCQLKFAIVHANANQCAITALTARTSTASELAGAQWLHHALDTVADLKLEAA